MDVAESAIAEIIDLVRGRHYQIACTRYFEATHKVDGHIPPISHPNQYVDLSMGRTTSRTAGMTAVKQEEDRATTSQVA